MRDTFLLSPNSRFSEGRSYDYETVIVINEKKYDAKIFISASGGKPKIILREIGNIVNVILEYTEISTNGRNSRGQERE